MGKVSEYGRIRILSLKRTVFSKSRPKNNLSSVVTSCHRLSSVVIGCVTGDKTDDKPVDIGSYL